MTPEPDFPHPIFVGGSARSGTHAIGALLESHERYGTVGVEARFHCANNGLADLLEDKTDLDGFCRRTLGPWWSRGIFGERGLCVIATREQVEAAVSAFRGGFTEDRWRAGRELMQALIDPTAERKGNPAWVDLSGYNVRAAPIMRRLFPRSKVIHMARDGRAVTASILLKRDQTDDREEAFGHWHRRILASHDGVRQMPPGSALTIDLDQLTALNRDHEFARLIEFLEIDDPASMGAHFDREISAERAHVGAWRERLAPADVRWVNRRYRQALKELRREGIDYLPSP